MAHKDCRGQQDREDKTVLMEDYPGEMANRAEMGKMGKTASMAHQGHQEQ
jgi:hypothetical protein